jgi:hypothetical protein
MLQHMTLKVHGFEPQSDLNVRFVSVTQQLLDSQDQDLKYLKLDRMGSLHLELDSILHHHDHSTLGKGKLVTALAVLRPAP